MAHLLVSKVAEGGQSWPMVPLDANMASLSSSGEVRMLADGQHDGHSRALLSRSASQWFITAGRNVLVLVNGHPLACGIRTLDHLDDISVGGMRYVFSLHDPAEIRPFPGGNEMNKCPRCLQLIERGCPAVRCSCKRWYHQSDELNCFAYSEDAVCSVCSKPTRLGEAVHVPED